MVMFDPLYVRPDDVGTQRNKSLIMAPSGMLPAVSATTPYRGESGSITPVARDRREQRAHDRRQGERRQQHFPCLIDTRSHRERRLHLRRHKDILQFASGREQITLSRGCDETA